MFDWKIKIGFYLSVILGKLLVNTYRNFIVRA